MDIMVLGYDLFLKDFICFVIEVLDRVIVVFLVFVVEMYDLIKLEKKIEMIYNFIDECVYLKKNIVVIKEKYGILLDDKVVIYVFNFRKVKCVQDVICVFCNIVGKMKVKLFLVGDGLEKLIVCEFVRKYGLED